MWTPVLRACFCGTAIGLPRFRKRTPRARHRRAPPEQSSDPKKTAERTKSQTRVWKAHENHFEFFEQFAMFELSDNVDYVLWAPFCSAAVRWPQFRKRPPGRGTAERSLCKAQTQRQRQSEPPISALV